MTAAEYEVYLRNLPVMPQVAAKIMSITEDNISISFKELEETIKVDPFLSSRILKVANSAMYARQKEITNLQTAITLLGFKTIKSLVMLVSASSMFRKYSRTPFYRMFWRHSLLTAFLARDIAARVGLKGGKEEVFLAGLFHDLGRVALFHGEPEAYSALLEEQEETNKNTRELERHYFGTDHKEVGWAILADWNFPDVFSASAREHGSLNITSRHKTVVLVVTTADILAALIDGGGVPADKQAVLEKIPSLIPLPGERIEYYKTQFLSDLGKDPLFSECTSIFNLS